MKLFRRKRNEYPNIKIPQEAMEQEREPMSASEYVRSKLLATNEAVNLLNRLTECLLTVDSEDSASLDKHLCCVAKIVNAERKALQEQYAALTEYVKE